MKITETIRRAATWARGRITAEEAASLHALADALEAGIIQVSTDEQLEAMVEAYESYQSPADQGLAQQKEGMRRALAALPALFAAAPGEEKP